MATKKLVIFLHRISDILFPCCTKRRPENIKVHPGVAEQWRETTPSTADSIPLRESPAKADRAISTSSSEGWSNPLPPPSPFFPLTLSKKEFTYEELLKATNDFDDANLLGKGGFGCVHLGIVSNGQEVAVKQMKAGTVRAPEFEREIEIISRIHHRNLVNLVGYCVRGPDRFLVYDFVPNYTLEYHLHGKNRPVMDFSTRMKIALGAARGLAYLHEDCDPKIIHRDIKAANILVDDNFEPKIADFGLAKTTPDIAAVVSTQIMGTIGYLDPEYACSGKLTSKSDVYSFGVVLLELLTGRRPVGSTPTSMRYNLVEWARPLLKQAMEDRNFELIIDSRLPKEYDESHMFRAICCAATCVRHSSKRRPRMSQVARALEGDVSLSDLHDGIRPGYSSDNDYQKRSEDDLILLSLLADFRSANQTI